MVKAENEKEIDLEEGGIKTNKKRKVRFFVVILKGRERYVIVLLFIEEK